MIEQLLANLSVLDKGNSYRIDIEDKTVFYHPDFDMREAHVIFEAHKGGMRPATVKDLRGIIAKLTPEDIENSPDPSDEDEALYDGQWRYAPEVTKPEPLP